MPIRMNNMGSGNTLAALEKAKQEGVKWQQPALYGQNYSNNYNAAVQGGVGIGNSMASAYGSQAGAAANLGNSMAQERGAAASARGMAEAARQGAIGNIGSAALGAYGSTAGSALGAWATNQTAYNKALSDMAAANQAAMSQFGQSRNSALAGLGASYAAAGAGMGAASGLGAMGGGYPGNDFLAMGPDGEVASGFYGGYGGGGGGQLDMSRYSDPAFAGMDRSLSAVAGSDIPNRLDASAREGYGRLDRQHMTSRGMPSAMMGQALSGLMTLGDQSLNETRGGMDQFYDRQAFGDYSPYLNSANAGYGQSMGALSGLYGEMGDQFGSTNRQLGSMWDKSMGREFGGGASNGASSPYGQNIGGFYYPAGTPLHLLRQQESGGSSKARGQGGLPSMYRGGRA
jgi:hypothetical protein